MLDARAAERASVINFFKDCFFMNFSLSRFPLLKKPLSLKNLLHGNNGRRHTDRILSTAYASYSWPERKSLLSTAILFRQVS
jgi:hypothetical protein